MYDIFEKIWRTKENTNQNQRNYNEELGCHKGAGMSKSKKEIIDNEDGTMAEFLEKRLE